MIIELCKPSRFQPQYVYLTNPYMQIACYVMYRAHDIEHGERMLKLVKELKELALKFHAMNKQTYRENYDSWSPYNVWLDIIVSKFINRTLDTLEADLFFKRNHPEQYVSFDVVSVMEIPPNTEGIPNNPLRLEHLRYLLRGNEKYITFEQLKQRVGYIYNNLDAMVENYGQVLRRYKRFYHDYLLKHGVDEALIKFYWVK